MKSISVVTQFYAPDIATTGQLLTELCIELQKNGFHVNVITAQPTYQKVDALSKEVHLGVQITRLLSTRLNKNSFVGKIFNSFSFFISTLIFLTLRSNKTPLLIVSNPPFLPLVGVYLKIAKGVPFIYLVHDVYPDIAVRLGYIKAGGVIEKSYDYFNKKMLKYADVIIVLSASMKNIIENKVSNIRHFSNNQKSIKIIHNWANGHIIKPISKKENKFLLEHGLQEKFVIMYSGNMGLFHDLEILVETARIMNDEVVFVLIGDGGKRKILKDLVVKYQLKNVMFLPYQPIEYLPQSLSAASVSIVTLEKNIEGMAMPSKLYTLLASGNPIIAICDEQSDVRFIIDEAQCGFTIRHHQVELLAEHIRRLKQEPEECTRLGNNARAYFEKHFMMEKAVEEYSKVIQSLPNGTG